MAFYIFKRLLLIIPTLFGIMLLNFIIIQAAPGGPIEQIISQITATGVSATDRITSGGSDFTPNGTSGTTDPVLSRYRGAQGLNPEFIKKLEKQYGFDKPLAERFFTMLWQYIRFDFDKSFFQDKTVVELLIAKLPVSISLGLWTTLLVYLIAIPLGIKKATRLGSRFDVWTSAVIIICYAIPSFLFAILLIVLFAGGSYLKIFPLRGLVSDNWALLSWPGKIADYFWHIALPVIAMTINGFTSLTILTKNSFLEEIRKQYVITARAKGLKENRVLYGHVFRNAMLIVIAGFPAAFLAILFTGSLLIEVIFSLDGIGLLGFQATLKRDYPVMFGSLYFFSLLALGMRLITDITYKLIDPRIDFERRDV